MPSSSPPSLPPSAAASRDRLVSAAAAFLPVAFSIGFLFQCALLPLVGKAAFHGSHSPGASRALWAGTNILFFETSGVLLLAIGALAACARLAEARRLARPPRVNALAALWLVSLFMLLAAPFGLFAI